MRTEPFLFCKFENFKFVIIVYNFNIINKNYNVFIYIITKTNK